MYLYSLLQPELMLNKSIENFNLDCNIKYASAYFMNSVIIQLNSLE